MEYYIYSNTKLCTKLQFLCGGTSRWASWPFDAPVLLALQHPGQDQGSTCGTWMNNYPRINSPTYDYQNYSLIAILHHQITAQSKISNHHRI